MAQSLKFKEREKKNLAKRWFCDKHMKRFMFGYQLTTGSADIYLSHIHVSKRPVEMIELMWCYLTLLKDNNFLSFLRTDLLSRNADNCKTFSKVELLPKSQSCVTVL